MDLSRFYTSTYGYNEPDKPRSADLLAESLTVCRAAWPKDSRYRIDEAIAAGGMGAILKAWDHDAQRYVAMKVMLRDDLESSASQAFLHEAHIVASLEHPNIVPVHEVGATAFGDPYFTMKWVQGDSLADILLKQQRGDATYLADYPIASLLDILIKIADAIDFAHSRGVWHLDLKPHNILIGQFGEAIVLDWGLAKLSDELGPDLPLLEAAPLPATATLLLSQGIVRGTPGFMAPEQASADVAQIDHRSDIFALGSILYTMVTHKHLIAGDSSQEMIQYTINGQFVPPGRRVRRDIPKSLEAIVMKCVALDPVARYESVGQMIDDLQAYTHGQVTSAEAANPLTHMRLFAQRFRTEIRLISFSALIILGLAVVFGVSWYSEHLSAEQLATGARSQDRALANAVNDALAQRQRSRLLQQERNQAQTDAQFARYLLELSSAATALRASRLDQVDRHLRACPKAHRHWEWHYLQTQTPGVAKSAKFDPPFRKLRVGERLLVGAAERTIRAIDAESLETTASMTEPAAINDHCLTGHDRYVVTASEDGNVRIWDLETRKQSRLLVGHRAPVTAVAADSRLIASGDAAGTLILWNARSGRIVTRRSMHDRPIANLRLLADQVVSADEAGEVAVLPLRQGQVTRFPAALAIADKRTARDADVILQAGSKLVAWDRERRAARLLVPKSSGFATLDDGRYLVATGQTLGIQEQDSFVTLRRTSSPVVDVAWADAILVASADGLLTKLQHPRVPSATSTIPLPASISQITVTESGLILDDGTEAWMLTAPDLELAPTALPVPQSDWTFQMGSDQTIRCAPSGAITLTNGDRQLAADTHAQPLVGAVLTPDSRRLITADSAGHVRIWTQALVPLLEFQPKTALTAASYWPAAHAIVLAGSEGDQPTLWIIQPQSLSY